MGIKKEKITVGMPKNEKSAGPTIKVSITPSSLLIKTGYITIQKSTFIKKLFSYMIGLPASRKKAIPRSGRRG
jgi:hypothetical protein